jgi:hypothetical protein
MNKQTRILTASKAEWAAYIDREHEGKDLVSTADSHAAVETVIRRITQKGYRPVFGHWIADMRDQGDVDVVRTILRAYANPVELELGEPVYIDPRAAHKLVEVLG